MEARIAQLEQQLRGLTIGVKTKDLSLAASIKEWSGSVKTKPVTEFLTQIEQCAKISNWEDGDLVNIVKAKLSGEALQFVNGRDQLTNEGVTYEVLKKALVERFTEKLPARYYYNLLHNATQDKNETPLQFLDRIRILSTKTMRTSDNPLEQRILREEADFRLLTSFIHGIRGDPGKELRYRNPSTIEEALNIATVVYNAQNMERNSRDHDVLTAKREQGRNISTQRRDRPVWQQRRQNQDSSARQPQSWDNRNRNRSQTSVTCFSCGRRGHMARDCDKREQSGVNRQQRHPN
jgi:hypothetical protein